MARNYLVFGSNDKISWAMLNTVAASGSQAALNAARQQEDYRHYAAVPERNWASASPEVVERPPVVKWKSISSDQLSVDDVLDDERVDEERAKVIEEARTALEPEYEIAPNPAGDKK